MDSVSNLGLLITDLKTEQTLVAHRADQLFTPASNIKVLTAASANHYLGKDFRFKTSVHTSNNENNNEFEWVALKGSGDPFLSLQQLDTLANSIALTGKNIKTLYIDASVFDEFYYGPGWMWDEGSDRNASPVGGLNLNWNTIDLYVDHSGIMGEVVITPDPITEYGIITDSISITEDSLGFRKLKADREWWNYSNRILVHGNVFREDIPDTLHSNIIDPTYYSGTVFKEKLEQRDITIGSIVYGNTPIDGKTVSEIFSPPLTAMTSHFLKETDNLVAEALLKRQGSNGFHDQGTWEGGLDKLYLFLKEYAGSDTNKIRIADGSGLSRYNLLSPAFMVDILKYIANDISMAEVIIPALPVSGTDGTLKDRMTDSSIKGKVLAKTGSLGNVSTLSGYVYTNSGRTLVFSMMMNGFTVEHKYIRSLQDKLCRYLVENM